MTDNRWLDNVNNEFRSFKELDSMGLIKRIQDDVCERLDCPKEIGATTGIAVTSTLAYQFEHHNKLGPLKPNLFQLVIGESGVGKTLLMIYTEAALKCVSDALSHDVVNKDYSLLGPNDFSPEGCVKYLAERYSEEDRSESYKHRNMIIIKHEAAELIKCLAKSYQSTLMEFYSSLFDGTRIHRELSKANTEVKGHYVTFLGGTTSSIYPHLDREFFLQGLGNRMLPIMFDYENDSEDKLTAADFFGDGVTSSFHPETYRNDMLSLVTIVKKEVQPNPDAAEIWVTYKKAKIKQSRLTLKNEPRGVEHIYMQRMPGTALKLAMLSAISRVAGSCCNQGNLLMDVDDMKWAIGRTEIHLDHHRRMTEDWSRSMMDRHIEATRSGLISMCDAFKDAQDGFLTQNELVTIMGVTKNNFFTDLLRTAVDRGDIVLIPPEVMKSLPNDVKVRHGISLEEGRPPYGYKLGKRQQ